MGSDDLTGKTAIFTGANTMETNVREVPDRVQLRGYVGAALKLGDDPIHVVSTMPASKAATVSGGRFAAPVDMGCARHLDGGQTAS